MTIQNQNTKNVYTGNGSTTLFPYTFAMNAGHPEYIHVYITGEDGTARETTDFKVDVNAGNVVYPKPGSAAPALAAGQKITLMREVPLQQRLALQNQGPFFAEDIEKQFDDLEMQIQQLDESSKRGLKVNVDIVNFDATITPLPGKSIEINPDGSGFVCVDSPSTVLLQCRQVAGVVDRSAREAAQSATVAEAQAQASALSATGAASSATAAWSRQVAAENAAADAAEQARRSALANQDVTVWDNETAYNAGQAVMTADGAIYQCVQDNTGKVPMLEPAYWLQRTSTELRTFEFDADGHLMPLASPHASAYWDVDEAGNIMPLASSVI